MRRLENLVWMIAFVAICLAAEREESEGREGDADVRHHQD
jgi:hypothetical protein